MECSLCVNESTDKIANLENGWMAVQNNVSVDLCPECSKRYESSSEKEKKEMLRKAWR